MARSAMCRSTLVLLKPCKSPIFLREGCLKKCSQAAMRRYIFARNVFRCLDTGIQASLNATCFRKPVPQHHHVAVQEIPQTANHTKKTRTSQKSSKAHTQHPFSSALLGADCPTPQNPALQVSCSTRMHMNPK